MQINFGEFLKQWFQYRMVMIKIELFLVGLGFIKSFKSFQIAIAFRGFAIAQVLGNLYSLMLVSFYSNN